VTVVVLFVAGVGVAAPAPSATPDAWMPYPVAAPMIASASDPESVPMAASAEAEPTAARMPTSCNMACQVGVTGESLRRTGEECVDLSLGEFFGVRRRGDHLKAQRGGDHDRPIARGGEKRGGAVRPDDHFPGLAGGDERVHFVV